MDFLSIEQALSDISFNPISLGVVIAILITIVLLGMSAFASASEIAYFSLSPSDLSELSEERTEQDKAINMLRDDSERTLATILITNNFVNVTIIMLCNYIFTSLVCFGEKAYWLQFLIVTVLLTFLLLLFGEIIPKVYSREDPLAFCRRSVSGILFFRRLFWVFESILLRSGFLASKVIKNDQQMLSVDELEHALELTDKNDIKEEQKMLQGIVRFGDETVREVMTSRQDIVALNINSPFSDVLKSIVENNYSRIPVYQNNDDNIKGVLYIKDLLPHLAKPTSFKWQTLMRPPHFVPETKRLDDMMKDFKENKVHIAIVVDEFGGTSGLITLEDILEEIVGEINDEYDEEDTSYSKLNYNTYVFDGKTLLSDVTKILEVDDDYFSEIEGDADSLAGLLLEIKGDFPTMHERIEYRNFMFEILKVDGRRISKVKITISANNEA
ncbi:gliding motility-associated protein GldE [Hoylesella nanceiensis]|uniref:Gliding motility-associated protein GldE n=2 Tax=Hoylesella nanceiensis TaxID=425941 RepID=A0ABS6YA55_9BACT|nr:gliding motility-associated protein GldE [Hoylesella nanceiensis]MBF1439577.1 gliding motility-associated protein GldE [Hoylesella nanceiensis]MBW4768458.1 gliding motility-associated protein GldE [Hoylesella nanceiensis]